MVIERGSRAAQQRIACIEMLVTVDRQRTVLDEAGSDTVRTLVIFAPDCAGPQSPVHKRRIVTGRATPLDRNAVPICKQHTATNSSDRSMESVEARLSDQNERFNFLPRLF